MISARAKSPIKGDAMLSGAIPEIRKTYVTASAIASAGEKNLMGTTITPLAPPLRPTQPPVGQNCAAGV